MKCVTCGKANMINKRLEYIQFGVSLGMFDALVCPKCNETMFKGTVSEQIEKKAKELGVWGLARKSRIGTSGTSLDVKIPKRITEFLGLKKGQEIIIEPRANNKMEITVI
ncbi:hypothetical protein COV16_03480 [Candidatus Woesearchaeota archaeon CG10_big_fil_rev_8_21_14_0_10_34_8]|nr:MAG: hypothetical protein COV16_03480 [Candidatus Woesearchaeota archaeon CG10_big_fil_rev_8_21_14_0_10_34_8]